MIYKKIVISALLLSVLTPITVSASNVPISTNICSINPTNYKNQNVISSPIEIIPMNYDIFMEAKLLQQERLTIETIQRTEEEETLRKIKITENNERLMQGNPGQQALRYALEEIGKPYYWGAEGIVDYDNDGDIRDGYDCSGLFQWAFWKAGYYIPRTTRTGWDVGQSVSRRDAQEGDLIYFLNDKDNSPVDHVGMYLGDNKMLHAPRPGKTVEIRTVPWNNMVSIRRSGGIPWESVNP